MNKLPELDFRRGVHVSLLPDTRNEFRIMCLRKGLAMQEVFEELAQRLVAEDPYMMRMLDELVTSKREHKYRQLSATDASSIYDIIEAESPWK